MKKGLYFLLALTAAACSGDNDIADPRVPEAKGTPIEVCASSSGDRTKSVFGDGQLFGQLLWTDSDELGIYYEQSANAVGEVSADKWDKFIMTEGQSGRPSATFSSTSMVWNEKADKHQFYAFYPVYAKRNAINPKESPYEKSFNLTNHQSPAVLEDAARNYEKYQILISDASVEKSGSPISMTFHPILSYLCIHVYADPNAGAYKDAKSICLSRLSVRAPEDTYLAGTFTINLKTKQFTSAHVGSSRVINIVMPGQGMPLVQGGREVSKSVYAVILPADMAGKDLTINGLLNIEQQDGTVRKYQIETKTKPGVKFESGRGYEIYVKVTPGTDLTEIFANSESGFIFRTNNKWYSFKDYREGKLTDQIKDMGTDLYFIKTNGLLVEREDVENFQKIGQLVTDIYTAIGKPVNVDMSNIRMDPHNSNTNQFDPGIFSKVDPNNEKEYLENPAWASVALPEGIRKINVNAFYKCVNLKTVTLPNSLTRLSKNAFGECSSLTSIVIPSHLNTDADSRYNDGFNGFMNAFTNCGSLSYVKLPSNPEVYELIEGTFSGCSSLKRIAIPRNITKLGANCFAGCPLTDITIRHRLRVIDIAEDSFAVSNAAAVGTLHVYSGLVGAYQEAIANPSNPWSIFAGWTVKALDADEMMEQ